MVWDFLVFKGTKYQSIVLAEETKIGFTHLEERKERKWKGIANLASSFLVWWWIKSSDIKS